MRAAFTLVTAGVAAAFAACGGGGSSFPDETECPPPAPIATSRANPGAASTDGYVRRVQSFTLNLDTLRSGMRTKYPEDTFYRREEFRPDFATYASQTVCTADALLQLTPPDARYAEFDSRLDAALTDLIAHTRFGREAVKSRNVSEYRDWYKEVDLKIAEVRGVAFGTVP
jgi:hypothetical protein